MNEKGVQNYNNLLNKDPWTNQGKNLPIFNVLTKFPIMKLLVGPRVGPVRIL
jgi:hypothetical protein